MNALLKQRQDKAKLDDILDKMDAATIAYQYELDQVRSRNLSPLSLAGYRRNIDNLFNKAWGLGYEGQHPLAHENAHNLGVAKAQDAQGFAGIVQSDLGQTSFPVVPTPPVSPFAFARKGWPFEGAVQ